MRQHHDVFNFVRGRAYDGAATKMLTMTPHDALAAARTKLEAKDEEAALHPLLAAWRGRRSPRIAEIIDRISERLTKAREPIGGKSIKARLEMWTTYAKKRNPADVGRLLAALWPAKLLDAITALEAMTMFPDDPRIAIALANAIHKTQYDSGSAWEFYSGAFAYLDRCLDVRTRPLLAAGMAPKSSQDESRADLASSLKKLDDAYPKGEVPLDAREETELRAIEELFASVLAAKSSGTKSESDFLAEIYAAPDDDSARAVFADWLTERGDPRGEFITLQLARHAGRGTPASQKREASLLKAHGQAWAGSLDRILDKNFRVFARGFLAEAVLGFLPDGKTMPKELSDPSFATMTPIMAPRTLMEEKTIVCLRVLKHPAMRRLRAIRNFQLLAYLAVVKSEGPWPTIEELHIGEAYAPASFSSEEPEPLPMWSTLSDGVAFPSLKRLGMDGTSRALEMLIDGALGKKLEVITLYDLGSHLGRFAKLLPKLAALPALKEARQTPTIVSFIPRSYWSFIFHRDSNGNFTRLHAETFFVGTKLPDPHELDEALAQLDPDSITELTVQKTPKNPFDEEDTAMLNKRVATFTKVTNLDVPWQR